MEAVFMFDRSDHLGNSCENSKTKVSAKAGQPGKCWSFPCDVHSNSSGLHRFFNEV